MLLGMSLTTLSMPTSGEGTGAPWDVSNYPLYANVRGRGLVLLGMYLTTLSMPTLKLNIKLEQLTHLCHRNPFVTMVQEAHKPAPAAPIMSLT